MVETEHYRIEKPLLKMLLMNGGTCVALFSKVILLNQEPDLLIEIKVWPGLSKS